MYRLTLTATLGLVMTACSGGNVVPAPTSPTVLAPDPTFTVSGVVVGQAGVPVEGVSVRVASKQATTDGSGRYTLLEVPRSYGAASAVKAGYAATREILTVSSDTRFDVQLGPRVAIHALSGVVSEMTAIGLIPIEGVLVEEYSCEEVSPLPPFFSSTCPVVIYQVTTTDKQGRYSFSGLYSGKGNTIGVSKEGFEDPFGISNGPEGPGANNQAVTIDGNTRFDIQLVRR